jgi:hypothetical protein
MLPAINPPLETSVMKLAGTPSTWPTHVVPSGLGSYRSNAPTIVTSGNSCSTTGGSRSRRRSEGPGSALTSIAMYRDRITVGSISVCAAAAVRGLVAA